MLTRDKYSMSERKWSNGASRNNGKLGGEIMRQRRISEYEANPKMCKGCQTVLVFGKHHNTFCSQSCSGRYFGKIKSDNTVPKPRTYPKKDRSLRPPYSTLYSCVCKHCGYSWQNRYSKKYCVDHEDLYSHNGRALFWFTFGISSYPDLFDGELIRQHGMRSKENPNGVTRDHRVSVNEAIRNGYDPYYITHPLNCELMLFDENNKKNVTSSITYEDLVRQVKEYDRMVGPEGVEPSPDGYEPTAITTLA